MNNTSILFSIKAALGIDQDDTAFDQELIMHINSAFMVMTQLGVTQSDFTLRDESNTWAECVDVKSSLLASIQTAIYLRVRLVFDPPANSFVLNSMQALLTELEWRLNAASEER